MERKVGPADAGSAGGFAALGAAMLDAATPRRRCCMRGRAVLPIAIVLYRTV
ncbi:MAG TPA: hypothetical protein VF184_09915 [Phycisphaeraceae bacterium]